MRKVVLFMEETLKYRRLVPVMVPVDMEEDALNTALDIAQRGAESVGDVVHKLRQFGIQQIEPYDDSLGSPDRSEVECDDYRFMD